MFDIVFEDRALAEQPGPLAICSDGARDFELALDCAIFYITGTAEEEMGVQA